MDTNYRHQQIAAPVLEASTALTLPADKPAQQASVQAVGGNVRYRLDGVAPTTDQGAVLLNVLNGGESLVLQDSRTMKRARFIKMAATSPVLEVVYKCTD